MEALHFAMIKIYIPKCGIADAGIVQTAIFKSTIGKKSFCQMGPGKITIAKAALLIVAGGQGFFGKVGIGKLLPVNICSFHWQQR